MSNQDRTSHYAGTGSQNLSADRFNIGTSDYRRNYSHDGFPYGQASSSDYRRGRGRSQYLDRLQGEGMNPYDSRTYPNQFGSQQASINGRILDHNEMPPLEEHYDNIPSRHPSYQMGRTLSQGYNPLIPSRYPVAPHMANTYMAPPIRVPSSANSYSRRRRHRSQSYGRDSSGGSYSSRSHSTDSLSSGDSRSYHASGNPYATILPTHNSPTVVQPSHNYPIVVPINGGTGGYVVVPPVGQNMRVIVRPSSVLPRLPNSNLYTVYKGSLPTI